MANQNGTSSPQRPNRFTTYFGRMKEVCPQAIANYARCVTYHSENENNDDDDDGEEGEGDSSSSRDRPLQRDSCRDEFAKVKNCFRQVRQLQRQEQQRGTEPAASSSVSTTSTATSSYY
ncbi:hypothetical protein ACA910_009319 [Epithemia clementina (nom. ined.)]